MKTFLLTFLLAVLAAMLLAVLVCLTLASLSGCDLPKGPQRQCEEDLAREARLEAAHTQPPTHQQ